MATPARSMPPLASGTSCPSCLPPQSAARRIAGSGADQPAQTLADLNTPAGLPVDAVQVAEELGGKLAEFPVRGGDRQAEFGIMHSSPPTGSGLMREKAVTRWSLTGKCCGRHVGGTLRGAG